VVTGQDLSECAGQDLSEEFCETKKETAVKTKKKQVKPAETSEIQDVTEALEAMRTNARLAAADIAKRGLTIKTKVTDNNGKLNTVERVNPMVKIQREALRSISSLKRQLAVLQEEEQNNGTGGKDGWEDFS
jgi:hypothetical protein